MSLWSCGKCACPCATYVFSARRTSARLYPGSGVTPDRAAPERRVMKKRLPAVSVVNDNAAARMLRNWMDERDSAALYLALAALECNPRLSRVFGKLAASEREHGAFW